MNIQIITDSGCDLPIAYVNENHIEVLPLEICINNQFIKDDLGQTLSYEVFYEKLKSGEEITTSQVNAHSFEEAFIKHVNLGKTVIYIGLSSGLSGTYNSAAIARAAVLEQIPDAKIYLVDSKSGSVGEGLLVHYANELVKEGKSAEDIVSWLEVNKGSLVQLITVDDLSFVKRGGRISSTAALVGGLLNIKPLLTLDELGKVAVLGKVKGRKKVFKYFVDEAKEKCLNPEEKVLFISHADCEKDALVVKEMIMEAIKPKDIVISNIGCVIGVHGGPGAMALMFLKD